MDTDFAHKPLYLLKLNEFKQNFDLVVGSRYISKNSIIKLSFFRRLLSYSSFFLIKIFFGHNFDSTNSFRSYNLKKIDRNLFKKIITNDYDFFYTSINLIYFKKYSIKQFPMKIYGRTYGGSKMNVKHILKSIINIFLLYIKITFKSI